MKTRETNLALATIFLALLGAAGCGKSGSSGAPGTVTGNTTGQCPPGQVWIINQCVTPSNGGTSFTSWCTSNGGTNGTDGATAYCKFSQAIYFTPPGYSDGVAWHPNLLPRLEIHSPPRYTSFAYNTGVYLGAGDRLRYAGSGKYGTNSSCDTDINTGFHSGRGTVSTNDGLKSALVAGDSGETFFLADNPDKVIQYGGPLYLGFNVDDSGSRTGCMQLSGSFRVEHCVDSAYTTYPCP